MDIDVIDQKQYIIIHHVKVAQDKSFEYSKKDIDTITEKLKNKYLCQNIYLVSDNQNNQIGQAKRITVSDVFNQQTNGGILDANHKCAIIKQADLKLTILNSKNMEIFAIKASMKSPVVASIKEDIDKRKIRNIVVKEDAGWILIQFYSDVSADRNKGYYIGNE